MKQKTQHHPRQMLQLKHDIGQKESQLERMDQDLQSRLQSAGRYRQLLYDLLPDCDDEAQDGRSDTRWQTREKATQTADRLTTDALNSIRSTNRRSTRQKPVARERIEQSRAKPLKSDAVNKGKTRRNSSLPRPETDEAKKVTSSERRDSDVDDTPRTVYNKDITVGVEKARCLSLNENVNVAPMTHTESWAHLSSKARSDSDSDSQYRSLNTKQALPSIESAKSSASSTTVGQTMFESSKDEVVRTKNKPVASMLEKSKQEPARLKSRVKQKFKLRSSQKKEDTESREIVATLKDTRSGSLSISNLEMFGDPDDTARGEEDETTPRRRRHTTRDSTDGMRDSNEFGLIGVKL